MKGREIKTLAVLLLIVTGLAMVMPTAEAKTYYTFAGHPAVRYEQSDMGYPLMKYIEKVEYDLKYDSGGNRYGVRLYLTPSGRDMIASGNQYSYVTNQVTNYVMTRPEWYRERTYLSVSTEILYHAQWGKQIVHIQYHYKDLEFWEQPFYGRI